MMCTFLGLDIEAGKQLIRVLDIECLDVKAAFWLCLEEAEEWRLYIAMPDVKERDPRESYSKVLNVLNKNKITSVRLSQISVIDPTDSLVTALSLGFKTGPVITDIDVLGSAFNGVYVRAAHIYRMNVR